MHTYISSTVAFKSKGSPSFKDFCCLNDRTECSSSWGIPFLIQGFAVDPRISFGLRQSTLIQWSASRRLILAGNYGNGCPRFAAKAAIYDCDRGKWVFCPTKERRIERRIACVDWERDGCDSCGNGSVDEMLSLLTDFVSRDSVRNSRSAVESARKKHIHRHDVCHKEKEVRVDMHSRREERYVGRDSWGRSSKGEVVIKSVEGCRHGTREDSSRDDKFKARKIDLCSRREKQYVDSDSWGRKSKGELMIKTAVEGYMQSQREDSSRDDKCEASKGTSSLSYYSLSSSGDLESNIEEVLQLKPEGVNGESSSGYKKDLRWDRKDLLLEEVEQLEMDESNMRCGESSTKRDTEIQSMKREDKVKSDVTRDDYEWESVKALDKRTEVLGFQESGIQRASKKENQSKMRMEDREESLVSSTNLVHGAIVQYSETDKQVVGQKEIRKESKELNKTSEMHEGDSERASSSHTIFNSRIKYREEDTASDVSLAEETREHRIRTDRRVSGKIESTKRSQNLTEALETCDTDIESTFSPQRLFKARVNDAEDNSTLVPNSVQQAREKHTQNNQCSLEQTGSRKESQRLINVSEIHATNMNRVSSSQRVSEMRINDWEESSTSVLNRAQETREQHQQTDEQVIRRRISRKESQQHTIRPDFHGSDTKRASSSSQMPVKAKTKDRVEISMPVLNAVHEAREQQMGASNVESRNTQVMVTPPQSHLVVRDSSAYDAQADENIDSGSNTLYTHVQGNNPTILHELDGGMHEDEVYEGHSELVVHGGTLDSANRFNNSSAQFVGEFVDMLRQEVSTSHELSVASKHTSEIQKESTSSITGSVSQKEQYMQQSSRWFSTGSGIKGPSDEIWDVAGSSSSLEPSRIEAPKNHPSIDGVVESTVPTNAGNVTISRSSRSLWSYIADIVHKGWGARTESHTPTMNSGARSSSNESLNSESWFSGHEPDDDNDENAKKGKNILKEPLLSIQTQQVSEVMNSRDKITEAESDVSTSMGILERGSAFKGASSISEKGDFERIEEEKERQGIPSSVVAIDLLFPLADISSSSSRFIITAADRREISESGEAQMSRSGLTELDEDSIRAGATEATITEGKDEQLKQRKLHRNKQVLRERFDEWEEAFRLEHEQRKTDEMFMGEALLEAKKAADSWEVPVGAVLVQNGKIISRGCNLVEELRDSTAHAEMICIREASNSLRTWRLAEATLYVTLEPCAMCAGAILQARIDTLVWGAPNKLLGADGSWVSLFPGEEEGRKDSDRPAGPVHPFHPKITIRRGILATECADVMQQFFQLRRKNKKPESPPSRLPVSNHPSKFFSKVHHIFNMIFCL